MPTPKGWALLLSGAAMGVGGRLLGIPELYEIGAVTAMLAVVSAITTARGGIEISATRATTSLRSVPGGQVEVQVRVHRPSGRRSPALVLRDRSPAGTVTVKVDRAGDLKAQLIGYQFAPGARGEYQIGPGALWAMDPFGLFRRRVARLPQARLIVYPHTEPLKPASSRTRDHGAGAQRTVAPAALGSEFFALREYAHGDDLRKVHWTSTARLGRFMIRQEEQHRQTMATVVLDDVTHAKPWAFEKCVEAAASIVDYYLRSGVLVRLLRTSSTHHTDLEFGRGNHHRDGIMQRLAVAKPSANQGPPLDKGPAGGVTCVITTTLDPASSARWATSMAPAHQATVVLIKDPAGDEARVAQLFRAGVRVIPLEREDRLSDLWDTRPGRSIALLGQRR